VEQEKHVKPRRKKMSFVHSLDQREKEEDDLFL
jgi:hypothetical protein